MIIKLSKSKAHYRAGSPDRHCGICSMFVAPHGCTKVIGTISESDVCDYFDRKKRRKVYDHSSSGKM